MAHNHSHRHCHSHYHYLFRIVVYFVVFVKSFRLKSDQIQGGIAPQCFSQQKLKLQHGCHGHQADYKKSVD